MSWCQARAGATPSHWQMAQEAGPAARLAGAAAAAAAAAATGRIPAGRSESLSASWADSEGIIGTWMIIGLGGPGPVAGQLLMIIESESLRLPGRASEPEHHHDASDSPGP